MKHYTVRQPKYIYVTTDGGVTKRRLITDRGYNGYRRRALYRYSQMNIMQKFIYRRKLAVRNWKHRVFYPWLRYTVRPFVMKWIVTPTVAAVFLYLAASWVKVNYGQPEVFQNVAAQESETNVVQVEQYYEGLPPALEHACFCESELNHTNKNGTAITGIQNPSDIGICQINREHHAERAKSLGIDLSKKDGNIQFAKILFAEGGLQPWAASINVKTVKCHSKKLETAWNKHRAQSSKD